MKRKLILGVLIAGLFFVTGYPLWLNAENVKTNTPVTLDKKAKEVGNKICPVMGEKINKQSKATYEYQGKIYNFCCAGCIEEFKRNPGKYIKKIEAEKKAESNSQGQAKKTSEKRCH